MKFSGAQDYSCSSEGQDLVYTLTIAPRDDTNNDWFAVECEGVLVHCGPTHF